MSTPLLNSSEPLMIEACTLPLSRFVKAGMPTSGPMMAIQSIRGASNRPARGLILELAALFAAFAGAERADPADCVGLGRGLRFRYGLDGFGSDRLSRGGCRGGDL